jgi:spoIIIJ-associated protein
MIKIEATTLEEAYTNAATTLKCSVSQLKVEIVQVPRSGFLGMFKKSAIIVATVHTTSSKVEEEAPAQKEVVQEKKDQTKQKNLQVPETPQKEQSNTPRMLNDTIMPASFVSDQDDEDEDLKSGLEYTADYDDEFDENYDDETPQSKDLETLASEVEEEINTLFNMTCFSIDKIEVSVYDEQTLLVEFKGEDAALLIGKEGYRYKALSYMIFNWFNSKYDIQLRLEIAEFLKNQEESVARYLTNVYENIEKDGRAQTKILDGVLVQIALKELRERYPDKYVVIRSTKDGLKYIIVNDYHNN